MQWRRKLQLQDWISTPKRQKDDFEALFKRNFKRKIINAKIGKICWQIIFAALTVTLRQKENDKPTPAATAAQTRYLSSSPAATLHGKHKVSCSGFLPKTEPMQHHAAIPMRSAIMVSCSGFLPKTKPLQHHAAIPMRSASTDSKTPYNYAHTSTPKAAWSDRYTAANKKR